MLHRLADVTDPAVAAAMQSLEGVYRTLVCAVRDMGHSRAAFDEATVVGELLRALAVRAARVRAQVALGIYNDVRTMTYVDLGGILDVSEVRARQLVEAGRRAERGKRTASPTVAETPTVVVEPPPPAVVEVPLVPIPAEVETDPVTDRPRLARADWWNSATGLD